MTVWIYTMASVMVVSALSLIGVFTLALSTEKLKSILLLLVSFAVGGLFGDALIHLIPESFKQLGFTLTTSLCIVSGVLIFYILEKFLRWQHCHIPASDHHLHPVVTLSMVGDTVHNMIDGMIIAASFMAGVPIGLATALAVILHEIPQELGHFGILVHGGLTVKKALVFNFLSALSAIAGAVIVLLLGAYVKSFTIYLLPITAGGFLYIAGSDLIPELQHGTDVKLSSLFWQFLLIVLGISMMAALVLLE